MKTIVWRKSRLFKLFTFLLILMLGYVLLTVLLSERGHDAIETREEPYLTNGLGNFEPREEEYPSAPGEQGKPYHLPPDKVELGEKSIHKYGMNMIVSDAISLERSIPDTRPKECRHWHYPENMGLTVSVVIVFHNEGWSTLLRNVHTVVKRTPKNILEEIVLVDDNSDNEELKADLDAHITRFDGKVKVVRNANREGLITARTIGARASKGDVIIFLDAHCEVNTNWVVPLLAPIYKDRTTMTVPFVDGIDYKNFNYHMNYAPDALVRGIFEWGFFYKELDMKPEERKARKHNSAPYPAPTHAGGLFAIDRKYFFELGAYDPGLLLWGGENFELSFKIWQCGGRQEWVPCSRVGHVYRGGHITGKPVKMKDQKKGPLTLMNYKRVVEVWMDEKHKEFFYTREPQARFLDIGDISDQLAIKEKFKCKSFTWFMDNIAPDMREKFPEPPPNLFWGELRNSKGQCVDNMGRQPPANMGASGCHGHGGSQLVRLNAKGQMGLGERCIDAENEIVRYIVCPDRDVSGPWSYDEGSKLQLHHRNGRCLEIEETKKDLVMKSCDSEKVEQQWFFKPIKPRIE